MNNLRPIGIFDSGMGGLTVVKEVMRTLPQEKIIYFGDTARVPYGPKSKETVVRFSIENILFLLKHNVKMIIIACNTASSVALSIVQENFKVPVMGVITPGVKKALSITKNNRIGVIGTKTTIKSKSYEKQILKISKNTKIYSNACPLFVPLVEEGWLNRPITKIIAQEYLSPFKKKKIDTMILGCTHYPLLKPVIKDVLGTGVVLVDSAKEVAQGAKQILVKENLLATKQKSKINNISFYVSDEPENFSHLGQKFLGFALNNVKKVNHV
ncbi:MAG: glutamate racemase [Candidatus Omnitrophota bacterium]